MTKPRKSAHDAAGTLAHAKLSSEEFAQIKHEGECPIDAIYTELIKARDEGDDEKYESLLKDLRREEELEAARMRSRFEVVHEKEMAGRNKLLDQSKELLKRLKLNPRP